MSTDTILVVGGTGNQGRAVIERLATLETDYEILALTRDASTEHAQATAALGVELVEGDLSRPDTLRPHVERADKVWATINFWAVGYDTHIELGDNLAAAIEAVGDLEHLVYSGAGDQREDTDVPHLRSHYLVSERLRETGVPYTAIKPVYFMENWEAIGVEDGVLAFPLDEETHHFQTTYYDTARASAVALDNTDDFAGTEYNIASDLLTLRETAEVISDVIGETVEPYHMPLDEAEDAFGEEFAVMCDHFINEGGHTSFPANIRRIERDFGFTPQTLEEYLRENGWEGGTDEPAHVPGWVKAMQ
ncbi:NmrA family NAD(P)-binding protein [Natronolimnohabitans sp. A-GB9]|uniref:NmrA family NAD(P)-binding protein n=1 Tax=Natronolimnohabitans sp. A-GB9 TaxID=3069757 RepID=UPI0027B1F923|nr:NmrA family NAD(P)-binding protein [Natronolimnohabitans sp. A-GB9]MDQ2052244.1 NmrA family NAD(P)-binding protein [Natronolimnohabitans sp. A-GB9]